MRPLVVYEAAIALVAVGSVLLVFLLEASVTWLTPWTIYVVDAVLIVVQLGDWFYGLYHAPRRRRYLAVTAWELPGLLPLAVAGAGPLRLLRLVRLVRVGRALQRTHAVVADAEESRPLLKALFLSWAAAGATALAALLVWIVERPRNPDLEHFSDALWWAVVTVTQVGYGDVVPQTPLGRAVAVMLMVAGIASFVILLSVISIALARSRNPAFDLSRELERLADLHEQGTLDDDEFQAAKARLLER